MRDPSRPACYFFHLPRELRDNIYDICLETRSFWVVRDNKAELVHIANADLLLVSRQFLHEYLAREHDLAVVKLTFVDVTPEQTYARLYRMLSLAKRMSRINVDVVVVCPISSPYRTMEVWIAKFIRAYRQRVTITAREFLRFEYLAVRIHMRVPQAQCPPEQLGPVLERAQWTAFPQLAGLEVIYGAGDSGEQQATLSWSKERRQLEFVGEEKG
ncbi:hypothetical protein M409DRAFT_25510 [Zasmidium cellare ATCC 36951]|uniref:Uncharacterized protein n=1 Tax=Zasmidium cellare ATCC 36951 TaxID=1080233 RepID=A0A6A6CAH4_ZASCE|nr:uncharacterized protein M409DRAFT_25510 [Zasmidium cellare ATCC 36951]KAF2164164.1 hypothetical protein M409DRAFT_25510 [Zasmidium cellare ATCC 36951]